MKKQLYLFGLLFSPCFIQAQNVGIGTTAPKAALDIAASNISTPTNRDGLLIPRVNTFPATNPGFEQNGMMIFLTTASGANQPGFYYWDNTAATWKGMEQNKYWSLNGNGSTNPTVNFIGTTDHSDVVFKRANVRAGLLSGINTSFGVNALNPLTTGNYNTAIGYEALLANTAGANNTAMGDNALATGLLLF